MSNLINSKNNIKEILLWTGILILTVTAFFLTYYFKFSSPVRVIIWLGWFVFSGLIAYFTSKGQKVFAFALEAKVELLKVVWPTRQETIQTTSIVMIMVTVTGFILWGVDSGMMWVIAKITHLG